MSVKLPKQRGERMRTRRAGRIDLPNRRHLHFDELEPRVVLSLSWTTVGEGSVADNVVTMGVVNRTQGDVQAQAFHGAYALLAPGRHYEIAFKYDLATWDSYNGGGAGGGYWD